MEVCWSAQSNPFLRPPWGTLQVNLQGHQDVLLSHPVKIYDHFRHCSRCLGESQRWYTKMMVNTKPSEHECLGIKVVSKVTKYIPVPRHASGSDIRQSELRACEGTLTGDLGVLMSFSGTVINSFYRSPDSHPCLSGTPPVWFIFARC